MPKVIDVPCPDYDRTKPKGTLWVHNRQLDAWWVCNKCPYCGELHEPENIRKDKLFINLR